MKKIILICCLFLSVGVLAEEVKVHISGMVCSLCAQGIEKKFSKEKGLENLKVDLDKKVVSFKLKEGSVLSDEKITSLITEAGYNVAKIQRD